jgi:hypothetical protein
VNGDAADQATFEALWKKVLADFDGDEAHGAFVQHAQRADLLPEAAKRYRLYREQLEQEAKADKLEKIDKRLGGIAMLAMAQLDASKTEPTPSNWRRIFTLVVALMTIAAIVGLFKALML